MARGSPAGMSFVLPRTLLGGGPQDPQTVFQSAYRFGKQWILHSRDSLQDHRNSNGPIGPQQRNENQPEHPVPCIGP